MPLLIDTSHCEADPNEHVREYLDYYISFRHPPQYAVLIQGRWGIGKTFLVREILSTLYREKKSNYIYVSLYGLSSFEELDRALRNAIYPILENRVAVVGTKVARAAMGFFNVKSELNVGDFTSKFQDSLYVFDDLERCALPIQKVMGYINEFVEHDGCKVIIIANEDAIEQQQEYLERREKTVGKVLEVQSSVRQALTYFLSKVDDTKTRANYQENFENIVSLFAQSKLDNLRILQQTLWDFERMYTIVDAKRKENVAAMNVLLNLFFALSFDVKSGRLKNQDIVNRQNAQLFSFLKTKKDDVSLTDFEKTIERYPDIDLTDVIISEEVIIEVLFKGLVRPVAIEASLAASHHFQSTAEEAPWRIVWHFMERPEAAVEAALARMEAEFERHEYVIPGEILHVCGLRLWAVDVGLIQSTRSEVSKSNEVYIDYLYEHGLLGEQDDESQMARLSGYGGLEILEKSTPEFKSLYMYLAQRSIDSKRNNFDAWGAELLDDMKHSRESFFEKTVLQNNVESRFYRIPVLASIDPKEFVGVLIKLQPTDQQYLIMALGARYEYGGLRGDLKEERSWLEAVRKGICAQLVNASLLTKTRFNRLMEWHIDKLLSSASEVDSEE